MNHGRTLRSFVCSGTLCLFILFAVWIGFAPCAHAANPPGSCSAEAAVRQLDFWLGNWSSKTGGGSSKVYVSLDKCLFTEHWDSGKGHVADKMFAYSPDDQRWYGMFADNQGRAHIFVNGRVESNKAEFHGTSRGPNGEAVLSKLTVLRTANGFEETWEKSTDNGASWTTVYRAEYVRQ